MRQLFLLVFACATLSANAQRLLTPFERSEGRKSASYEECIRFYRELAKTRKIALDSAGTTDAGYPLHVISTTTGLKNTEPVRILINNGIHPGEPDGIDACMMLLRDIAEGRFFLPPNVQLYVIPVYNIGGALNRNNTTRVNQVGPEEYGFRGNSQNLDLNRDFTKRDSREARSFARIFASVKPDILVDNHVSDGADYQHTMTLLSSQYDKLGGSLGKYFRETLDPQLYHNMDTAGWPMIPYVNAEETPDKGWTAFYDPPRFSSGYASLFNTIAWVPETHMLKPFDQRVKATYTLMREVIKVAANEGANIKAMRQQALREMQEQTVFPLSWTDSAATKWPFKAYAASHKPSEVTGQQRLYYDRSKPFDTTVEIRDHYAARHFVKAPTAYIIPQGWHEVTDRLKESGVPFTQLPADTFREVTAYMIDSFKTLPNPYEKHYKHSATHVTPHRVKMKFLKGDYLVPVTGEVKRFLVEMLEPEDEDSYFAWNYFDAILQRKEGYSDYRWEDVAAEELRKDPGLREALKRDKASNPELAKDAAAQLFYVYRHSKWFEPGYMRYPVYRLE